LKRQFRAEIDGATFEQVFRERTGHDRCIVPLRPESLVRWLDPESRSTGESDALREYRQRPYYEHRLAA